MIEIIDSLNTEYIYYEKEELERLYEELRQGDILYNIEKLELEISYIEELENINNRILNNDIIEEIELNNKNIKLYNQNNSLYNNYCKIIEEIDASINNMKLNEMTNKNILMYREEIDEYTDDLITTKNRELILKNKREKIKNDILRYNVCVDKLKKNEDEVKLYEIIIKLTSPKGIPRRLINIKLEMIEDEVNSIILPFLSKKIFITREIEDIKVFITDMSNVRHNSCGGMETFIIALAFKIAFTSVFNIQSSGLLIIDEGVSVLDKDHIQKFNIISDFLKKYYNNIILITHIDTFHDYTLTKIKILRKDNYSYLYF
jgi:DNA repair exonuclease SbcCD ATPase subunit